MQQSATIQAPQAKRFEFPLMGAVILLVIFGLLLVFDSSYARSADSSRINHDTLFHLRRQSLGTLLGLTAMIGLSRLDYRSLRKWTVLLLGGSIILLLMCWVPGIGQKIGGAYRWIKLGPIQMQPSELAKMAMILWMGAKLSEKRYPIRSLFGGLALPLCVIGFLMILIEQEPDLGTAIVVFGTGLSLLALAGAKKRHLCMVVGGAMFLGLLAVLAQPYRADRIRVWLAPEKEYKGDGYQITRGLIAVGSGGITGVGIGAGREKFYLPASNTDYIFATLAEEGGLVGGLTLIGLLMSVSWFCFSIAQQAKDRFGALIAGGVGSLIAIQSLINIAVVCAAIPATGVPLPFISYGNSSLVILLAGIGLVLSVARCSNEVQAAVRPR